MIILVIISCKNNKSKFTNGEWIETIVYSNESKTDSFAINDRIKFMKSGEMLVNKYNPSNYKYKIKGDKFYYIHSDTITATYDIVDCAEDEIILETKSKIKYNSRDTLIYRLFYYKKTSPSIDKPYDLLLHNMAKLYDIGKADTLGDGTIFYNFSAQKFDIEKGFIYDNPYKTEPKIKGVIDKTLGILPKVEKIEKFSEFSRNLYNYYEWETLDFILKMENIFDTSYDKQDYLNIKIWITEK